MSRSMLPAPMWDLPPFPSTEECTACQRFDGAARQAEKRGNTEHAKVYRRQKENHLTRPHKPAGSV
ncbi:hypothetical protein [Streptomyces luteireticuli]|uniref:Uncharacterized protein n=1 Tax=Streptomyces luteireticuli TaxID=173858 RepID=A0ABN0Z6S3_9ACTN